jgi:hypothetical protein
VGISWLNGMVERPNHTIANKARALLINSNHNSDKWCFAVEAAADIYRMTWHSSLKKSPYEAWYGIKPSIDDLRIWGCQVFIKTSDTKKSDPRAVRGYFMGYTKSRVLIRWWDPSTNQVKHAFAVCFDEYNVCISPQDIQSPGSLLLTNIDPSTISLPERSVDLSPMPHFESNIFSFELLIPKTGTSIGCVISVESYYNLPYISSFQPGTQLAQNLLRFGNRTSTFWVLSLNSAEFIKADAFITYLKSLQNPTSSSFATMFFARRVSSSRTSLETNRAVFNQIRLNYHQNHPYTPDPHPVIVPIARCIVTLQFCPKTPAHVGELATDPFRSDWKGSLFDNHNKMQTTSTFSQPMLHSQVPSGKTILQSCIAFHVKYGETTNAYYLYARTCADGSSMREGVDFTNSYSPVGSIDSIWLIVALAASQ